MSRVLKEGNWFEEISSNSLYETEYEKLIIQEAPHLFPGHHLVPFKKLVSSQDGDGKPDMALIDNQYRNWSVVEVELGHHALNSHVLRQVSIFRDAIYGSDDAKYLFSKAQNLNHDRLEDLMKGAQPEVTVISNKPSAEWDAELSKAKANFLVIEIFRSAKNEHLFSVQGEIRSPSVEIVSKCRTSPVLTTMVELDSPAALGAGASGTFTIMLDGSPTYWSKLVAKNAVYLTPVGSGRLDPRKRYNLVRELDGKYAFQEID